MAQPERIVNVIKQLVEIAAGPCENCTRLEAANARLRAAASKARQNREARNLRLRVKAEKQRQARQHAAAEAQAAEQDHLSDAAKKACPVCGEPVIPPRRDYCSRACSLKAGRKQSIQRKAETMRAVELDPAAKAIRTCLRCNAEFSSWGPGNRICPRCTKIDAAWPSMTMRRGRFVGKMA